MVILKQLSKALLGLCKLLIYLCVCLFVCVCVGGVACHYQTCHDPVWGILTLCRAALRWCTECEAVCGLCICSRHTHVICLTGPRAQNLEQRCIILSLFIGVISYSDTNGKKASNIVKQCTMKTKMQKLFTFLIIHWQVLKQLTRAKNSSRKSSCGSDSLAYLKRDTTERCPACNIEHWFQLMSAGAINRSRLTRVRKKTRQGQGAS